MVCVVEQPYLTSALKRVELCRRAINFEENALRHVFGFGSITNDLQRNAVHETMISIVKYGQSVAVPSLQLRHYMLVTQVPEFASGESAGYLRYCRGVLAHFRVAV